MELVKNEAITNTGLHISMPVPGIIRVTDGNHKKPSYMVSAKLRKAAPKVEDDRLTWGKVAIEPENDMAIFFEGRELCRDYTLPRKPLIQVSDEELARRKAAWVCPEPRIKTGYLARYAKLVSSADKGAVLS